MYLWFKVLLLSALSSCQEPPKSAQERMCDLFQIDGTLKQISEIISSIKVSFKECPACFNLKSFLERSCKSSSIANDQKSLPHPEFIVVMSNLKNEGQKGEQLVNAFQFYCKKLNESILNLNLYLSEFCKIIDAVLRDD